MIVREETPHDFSAIREINLAAFRDHPFSRQTEHLIVEALRDAGALELSLVAEVDGVVVGHVAFSSARIGDASSGWFLLGPVAVTPQHQGRGVGRALIEAGLEAFRGRGASGLVLVGDPAFYDRFGFRHFPGVTCAGVPDEYVLCLPVGETVAMGEVWHHPAFSVRGVSQSTRLRLQQEDQPDAPKRVVFAVSWWRAGYPPTIEGKHRGLGRVLQGALAPGAAIASWLSRRGSPAAVVFRAYGCGFRTGDPARDRRVQSRLTR